MNTLNTVQVCDKN